MQFPNRKLLILIGLLLSFMPLLAGQFFGADEVVEPDIEAIVKYDEGFIL